MMRLLTVTAAGLALALSGGALAQPGKGGDKGGDKGHEAPKSQQQGDKGGGPGHAKHQHHQKNAHALLGAKLKQDGKHAVGKFKNRDVTAEVKGGKVVSMAAGDIAPKRVRTKTKMADSGGLMLASWGGQLQLAQYDTYYYGYCFDDGYDYDCYWYPAEDVDYQDYTWEDYDPYW
jgi:hypothetical protein